MKLFKKLFVLALALVATFVLVACDDDKDPDDKTPEKTVLTVGTPALSGDFVAGFGSSAYDVYVRDLIHGYGTLVETEDGQFVWDVEAVLEAEPTTTTKDGNKTYTFKLQDDLKFNNGDPITAKEYVATILLRSAYDWMSIATSANAGYYLVGFDEYRYGTDEDKDDKGATLSSYTALDVPFKGVRLINDLEFSLTIDAENLPYFYEPTMVSSAPLGLSAVLPGFDVKDDGQGAYITDVDAAGTIKEVIAVSVNNSKTGQRYVPTLTTGPYQFVSFSNQIVIVEKNPNFKSNYEGKTPFFDEVVIKQVPTQTDVQEVISGTVDIVSGVISDAKIKAAEASTTADYVSYARNGYGLIAFAQYWGPTQYEQVRRAMAYLLDRRVFLDQFLGGYGTLVNGPYGEAQWFYKETKDELDNVLTNYVLDIEQANAELDNSPYKYEADGETLWDPAKAKADLSYLRHDAEGNQLAIRHFSASEEVGDIILLQFQQNAWQAGLKFDYEFGEFDTLLDHYYYGSSLSEENRTYHSFNLATNFYSDYDPYWSWHSELAGTTNNPGGTKDAEIDRITEEMQKLDPTAREEFKELFVEFVVRWNEILPNIPIYSNEYFDVYNTRITGLKSTPVWSWAKDICDIKLAE